MLAPIRFRNADHLIGPDPKATLSGYFLESIALYRGASRPKGFLRRQRSNLMLARVARRTTRVLRFLPVLLIGFWLAEAIAWPHFANAEDGGGPSGGTGSGAGTGGGSGSAGAGEGEGSSSSAAGVGAGASGQAGSGSFNASGMGALGRFFDHFDGNSGPSGNSGHRNPTLDTLVAEQGLASAAVSQGKIRPFSEILHAVADAVPGSILSVHLRQKPTGSWIYNLVILSPEGRYRKITVDATNSRVLQIK